VRMEELDAVCRQAARDLLERDGRPLRPAVVLPLPQATRVTSLEDFPDDDDTRAELLARFAADVMSPANAPAWGFVAEASAAAGEEVVVVVYGARNNAPMLTAAPLTGEGIGDFGTAESLAPGALSFLHPLQHAADHAEAPDVMRVTGD
jgi:hypothetical protein